MVKAVAGSPYATIAPLIAAKEIISWVPQEEQLRVASYFKYDDMYWNVPDTFLLQQRGDDTLPILVPNPRTIVDTTAHYYLKGLKVDLVDSAAEAAKKALEAILTREQFYSKFHTGKHAGVTRGDFLMHITADPTKPEGERISFNTILPHTYFPLRQNDPTKTDDTEAIIGVFIAEQYTDENNDVWVRRLHYWYGEPNAEGGAQVFSEEGLFETDSWYDPDGSLGYQPVTVIRPPAALDDLITRIPVYHFKNQPWDGEDYGRSELSGFERIMAGVDQSISDEEVALALEGLGVYFTDAASPVDDAGNETDWEIGPGRVMQVPTGGYFKRVEGISSVTPMQDHVKYLDDKIREGSGTSDVATGDIDVATADSGMALSIKFMPTEAKLSERDQAGIELLTLMFQDWANWHMAYEDDGLDLTDVELDITIGDKLPVNRTQLLNELNNMHDRNIISSKTFRRIMTQKLGYTFADNEQDQILKEIQAMKEAGATSPTPDTGNLADPTATVGAPAPQDAPPTSGGDPTTTSKGTSVPTPSRSNNSGSGKTNESRGTEATNGATTRA